MEEDGYSLVFLFDLDAVALTGTEIISEKPEDLLNLAIKRIHRESVRILSYFSSLDPKASVRFGYRFYSSQSFKPGTDRTTFRILDSQLLEELEEALYSKYEQHLSTQKRVESDEYEGKTVKFSPAGALGKSLQEVLMDFGWKKPERHTPKKRILTKSQQQNDRPKTSSFVIAFAALPADENFQQFCHCQPGEALSTERLVDTFVPESYFQKFKSFKISISFCDTSPFPTKRIELFTGVSKILQGMVISLNSSPLLCGYRLLVNGGPAVIASPHEASCSRCKTCPLPKCLALICGANESRATTFCLDPECVNISSQSSSVESKPTQVTCVPVSREGGPRLLQNTRQCQYLIRTSKDFFHLGVSMMSKIGSNRVLISPLDSSTGTLAVLAAPVDDIIASVSQEALATASNNNSPSGEVEDFVSSLLESSSVKLSDVPKEPTLSGESHNLPRFDPGYPCGFMHASYSTELTTALKKSFVRKAGSKDLFTQLKEMFSKKGKTPLAVRPKKAPASSSAAQGIQNSRAFKLLNKSREVRAKIEDVNRERDTKEQMSAHEKRAQRSQEKFDSLKTLTESLASCDRETILDKINELKEKLLKEDEVTGCQMYCFTQGSVSAVIKYFRQDETRSFDSVADVFRDNFCLNAAQVNIRYKKEANLRLREYQLQVLLRAELAWVLPSAFNTAETQEAVLSFLRLLSLHGSAQLMSAFMQDSLVDSYVHALPDMLTSVYNSLNQPAPAILTETFSPAKLFAAPSPCVNLPVQSVQSVGQSSKRSTPQPNENDSLSQNTKETRSRTLLRHPSFNEHNLRRKISLPAKALGKETSEQPPASQQHSQPSCSQSAGPSKAPNRVRRNLCLQLGTPSKAGADQSTPVKRVRRTSVQLPADEFTTPSKAGLFVPDTPHRATRTSERKKTDGTTVVGESPEIKTGHLRRSPRRLEACLALRRRASFYASSGADTSTGSRNWTRGESQVWTEKSAPVFAAEENSRKNSLQRTSSAQFLFSRIFQGKGEDDEQLAVPSTPVKEARQTTQGATRQETGSGFLQQTPMKTPKRVHFDFDPCQATPTPSKRATPARGILKSPGVTRRVLDESSLRSNQELALQSPPKSNQSAEGSNGPTGEDHTGVKRALDETSLTANKQLDLQSPAKALFSRLAQSEVLPEQNPSAEISFKRRLFGALDHGPALAKKPRHSSITPLKPGSVAFSSALHQLENSPLLHTPSNSDS